MYKYDPDCGVKFLTYALYWIRQSIGRYLQNNSQAIRFPVHLQEKLPDYLRFISEYQEHNDQPPDRKTICEALRINMDTAKALEKHERMSNLQSLDEPIGLEDDDRTLADVIPDDYCLEEDSVATILTDELNQLIWTILDNLKVKRRDAVIETIMKARTLEQTAQKYGLSRERIRQLRQKALEEIRMNPKFNRLQDLAFDLYGAALQGTGLKVFERTFTSATEHSAFMDLRRQEEIRTIFDRVCCRPDFDRTALRDMLKELEPDLAKALIVQLVPDPEKQKAMLRIFCEGIVYKQLFPGRNISTNRYYINKILDDMLKEINQIRTETGQAGEFSPEE